ncbi:MAG: N-acetyltransferase family protein [Acidimicrobiia bacterium]
MTVRPLQPTDRPGWDPLWRGYLDFYRASVPDDVTDALWHTVCEPAGAISGLAAVLDGELVGFVHYLFHPSTWSRHGYCYLEDLFTAPQARNRGVGGALIGAVVAAARSAGMDKVYWQTQESNAVAQALYDRVARRPGFVIYEIDTTGHGPSGP